MTQTEAEARKLLEHHLSLRSKHYGDWAVLMAAVRQALAGDAAAAPTLMRVFTEPGFAISNSLNEVGLAALSLALLGVRDFIPHAEKADGINFSRVAIPLALKLCAEAK